MTSIVYMATNIVNKKRYIGVTRRSIAYRSCLHIWAAFHPKKGTGCPIFYAAIRKYGADAFQFEAMETFDTYDQALAAERRYIAALKPEYNVAAGGGGPQGVKWTSARRIHMAAALRSAWTDERKRMASQKFKGRKISDETRAKIRAAQRPEAYYKPVVCLDDGLWFPSVGHASKHYSVARTRIAASTTGREIAASGLHFAYAANPWTSAQCGAELQKRQDRRAANHVRLGQRRSRAVICLTDGVTHKSGRAAGAAHGLSASRVMQLCQSGLAGPSGLRFMYADEESPRIPQAMSDEEVAQWKGNRDDALRRSWMKRSRAVICEGTGETYPSAKAAAQAHGFAHASVWNAITRRAGRIQDKVFAFVDGRP